MTSTHIVEGAIFRILRLDVTTGSTRIVELEKVAFEACPNASKVDPAGGGTPSGAASMGLPARLSPACLAGPSYPTRLVPGGEVVVGGKRRRAVVWVTGGRAARILCRHDWHVKQVVGLETTVRATNPGEAAEEANPNIILGGVVDACCVPGMNLALGLLVGPPRLVMWGLRRAQIILVLPLEHSFLSVAALKPPK